MSYAQSNSVGISVTLNVPRDLCFVNLQSNAVPFVLTETRNLSLECETWIRETSLLPTGQSILKFPLFFFSFSQFAHSLRESLYDNQGNSIQRETVQVTGKYLDVLLGTLFYCYKTVLAPVARKVVNS